MASVVTTELDMQQLVVTNAAALRVGQQITALGIHYQALAPDAHAEEAIYLPAPDSDDAFIRVHEIGRCAPVVGEIVFLNECDAHILPPSPDGRVQATRIVPRNIISTMSHFGTEPTPDDKPWNFHPALVQYSFFEAPEQQITT